MKQKVFVSIVLSKEIEIEVDGDETHQQLVSKAEKQCESILNQDWDINDFVVIKD